MRWMTRWTPWLLVGVFLSGLPGVARAESDVDILLNVLVENGTLTPVQAGQVRRQIAETKEARNKQLAKEIVPDSARNWKWGATFASGVSRAIGPGPARTPTGSGSAFATALMPRSPTTSRS